MSEEGEADFDAGQISEDQLAFVKEAEEGKYQRERQTAPGSRRGSPPGADVGSSTGYGGAGDSGAGDTQSVHSNGSRRGEHDVRHSGGDRGGRSSAARSPPPMRWGRSYNADDSHRHRRDGRSRSRSRPRGYDHVRYSGDNDPTYGGGGASPRRGGYRADEGDYHRSSSYRLASAGSARYGGDREYGRTGYYRQYEREAPPRYRRRESERLSHSRAPGYASREEADDGYTVRRDIDKDRAIDELRMRVRSARPPSRERGRPTYHVSAGARDEDTTPPSAKHAEPHAASVEEESRPVNIDDLEEGEHIEGEADAARPATPEFRHEAAEPLGRSGSRSRARDTRERSRSPSRDYDRTYSRRRYDEYRTRDAYAGRSGYRSRYAGGRSPDTRDSAYRIERRYHASPARPRSRSRSPAYSRRHYHHESQPASPRPGDQRWYGGARDSHRSPARHPRDATKPDDSGDAGSALAPPPPPPPPPPPLAHSSSVHGHHQPPLGDATRNSTPPTHHDSPYRGGYASRSYRRGPRTPRSGAYEYSPHSRDHSVGGYHQGHAAASRGHSPGGRQRYDAGPGEAAVAEHHLQQNQSQGQSQLQLQPQPQQPLFPEFKYGSDLHVSRHAEAAEWLDTRQQLRDATARVVELSAAARKSAFEMSYAKWGVLKTDSLVQLAAWQLERAEQGLGLSERTMIDVAMDDL